MQVFHSSPPGAELDACLWSLTEVLKRLLKGAHQGKNCWFCAFTFTLSTSCCSFSLDLSDSQTSADVCPKSKDTKFYKEQRQEENTKTRIEHHRLLSLTFVVLLCLTTHLFVHLFFPSEILGNLVAAFDSSICALSSKFLPERKTPTQCLVDFTTGRHWRTTFCLLLDLLEVLTASSLMSGADVCLKSQRITHLHSSALLSTVSCTSEYAVKKRALLLLKRAVLQQAGEDWALGEVVSSGLKYEQFSSDMNMLAKTVLIAVAANWLECVQVQSASFFGGTRHITGDEDQKPDCVILRAVSLLLLKSVELHVQTVSATGENP